MISMILQSTYDIISYFGTIQRIGCLLHPNPVFLALIYWSFETFTAQSALSETSTILVIDYGSLCMNPTHLRQVRVLAAVVTVYVNIHKKLKLLPSIYGVLMIQYTWIVPRVFRQNSSLGLYDVSPASELAKNSRAKSGVRE